MAIVDELITIIGLKVDSKNAKEVSGFSKSIGGLISKTVKLGAALTAAAGGISAYTVALAGTLDEQGKFTDSLGISIEQFQALGYAAGISGGSIDTLAADLKTLSQVIDTSNPGSYNEALLQLGVSARKSNGEIKNSTELLLDLSDKFATLSQKQAVDFGDKIGLDESTVRLLQTGRDGVKSLTDEAFALGGVLSDTASKDAANFNDALLRLRFSFFGIVNTVTSKFFPIFTDLAGKISDFVKANRKWIDLGISQVLNGVIKGFSLFKDGLSAVIDKISDLLPDAIDFEGTLDGTKVIAIAVAGALTTLAASALSFAAPFIAAGTAVSGVFIALEDLYAFIQGNDSVIGDFVNSFTERFPAITAAVVDVANTIKDAISTAIDFAISSLKTLVSVVQDTFGFITGLLGKFYDNFDEGVEESGGSLVKGYIKGLGKDAEDIASFVKEQFAPTPAPIVQQTSAANSVSNNTTVNQNIFGAGDPRAVGQQVVERGGFANLAQQAAPGFLAPISQ